MESRSPSTWPQIYTWAGEKELAIEQIATIERVPNYLSYGFLKLQPTWDSLRGDPRFEKIVSSLRALSHNFSFFDPSFPNSVWEREIVAETLFRCNHGPAARARCALLPYQDSSAASKLIELIGSPERGATKLRRQVRSQTEFGNGRALRVGGYALPPMLRLIIIHHQTGVDDTWNPPEQSQDEAQEKAQGSVRSSTPPPEEK